MGIRYQISKLEPTSITTLAGLGLDLDMGQENKRRRDPGLSLFKLDTSVDATVEMGSKGVREWCGEFSRGLLIRIRPEHNLTTGDVILSDSEAFDLY
jgi:hypothetical protein